MSRNLWTEIERVCQVIKHTPDSVDLDVVRSLLRRLQVAIDVVYPFLSPTSMTVRIGGDDFATRELTVSVEMTDEQYIDFLEMMIDNEDKR
jgi:hypothetical protein